MYLFQIKKSYLSQITKYICHTLENIFVSKFQIYLSQIKFFLVEPAHCGCHVPGWIELPQPVAHVSKVTDQTH